MTALLFSLGPSVQPPIQVRSHLRRDGDQSRARRNRALEKVEYPVDESAAALNDHRDSHYPAQLLFNIREGGPLFSLDEEEPGDELLNLLWGNGDDPLVQVDVEAQSCDLAGRRANVGAGL